MCCAPPPPPPPPPPPESRHVARPLHFPTTPLPLRLADYCSLYAVYGGLFIGASFAWGAVFDGMKVDWGDIIGSIVCLIGVGVILFWRRDGDGGGGGDGDDGSASAMAESAL